MYKYIYFSLGLVFNLNERHWHDDDILFCSFEILPHYATLFKSFGMFETLDDGLNTV